jgi:hypothetical protein
LESMYVAAIFIAVVTIMYVQSRRREPKKAPRISSKQNSRWAEEHRDQAARRCE